MSATSMLIVTKSIGYNAMLNVIVAFFLVFVPLAIEQEGRVFPVIKNFSIIDKSFDADGDLRLSVQYDKVRNCSITHVRIRTLDDNGFWIKRTLLYPDTPDSEASNMPSGRAMVHWKIGLPQDAKDGVLEAVFNFKCWGKYLWDTRTLTLVTLDEPK